MLDGLQPDHGGGDGQRERIVDQVSGGGFGLAGQRIAGEDFHGDDAHVLTLSHRKRQRLEALVAGRYRPGGADHIRRGGVESHLAAIEIVALEGQFHGGWGVMAGDADETRKLLFTGLEESFEDATLGLDTRQVVLVLERVDVDEIHLADLQVLQALLDSALNRGAISGADLGGEEVALLTSAGLEAPAQQLFTAAARVAVGGVEVGDAGLRRLGHETDSLLVVAGLLEALAAAEGERGDPLSGVPQQACGSPGSPCVMD